jgi:inward rectifier potassium channel
MVEAQFRLIFTRDEITTEGDEVRRFYPLKLELDHAIIFPAALTLRHFIDEQSPLHGATPESLEAGDAFLLASVDCIETVIPAAVQCQKDYVWQDVRFGERFVEIYQDTPDGRMLVDYGRLHETEPAPMRK